MRNVDDIKATAAWLLVLYIATPRTTASTPVCGHTQNDIVKEYLSRGRSSPPYQTPPDRRHIAYTVRTSKWNPINVCTTTSKSRRHPASGGRLRTGHRIGCSTPCVTRPDPEAEFPTWSAASPFS